MRLLSRGGREASRASHRPRAPGRATPGRLVGGALFAAVPVPGRTSGWAARTPRTRLRLGEPLPSMPTDDDIDPLYRTCSASPKRGGDGPVWGS